MNKPWKIIKKEDFKNTAQLIQELQEKKYILSEWILDIFKNYVSLTGNILILCFCF